jgi:serine/threonine protein kinase
VVLAHFVFFRLENRLKTWDNGGGLIQESHMTTLPVIPGYKIVSLLGEGGVAKVYLAMQERLNRTVAIKLLNPFNLRDKEVAKRFEREAKTAAGLNHSNIVQIYDTGKAGEYHYITMEYMQDSLKERLRMDPEHKLTPSAALHIMEELLRAMDYVHFKGVYHRDIKPENIMFRQDSTPVFVDFGIARVYDSSVQLTGSDSIMGTIHYMSPEQCSGLEVDGRSDIYSLGVVLFEMLTGIKPYKGKKWITILHQHIEAPVPLLPTHLRLYQPLIDHMMAKDISKRISTGAQFMRLLNHIKAPQQ